METTDHSTDDSGVSSSCGAGIPPPGQLESAAGHVVDDIVANLADVDFDDDWENDGDGFADDIDNSLLQAIAAEEASDNSEGSKPVSIDRETKAKHAGERSAKSCSEAKSSKSVLNYHGNEVNDFDKREGKWRGQTANSTLAKPVSNDRENESDRKPKAHKPFKPPFKKDSHSNAADTSFDWLDTIEDEFSDAILSSAPDMKKRKMDAL